MVNPFLDYIESKRWLRKEDVPTSFGLYAIFLKNLGNLPPEWQTLIERNNRLLYIGKAEDGLRKRLNHHFSYISSSGDTFKRSLGAVLINSLNLNPLKAGNKYKFDKPSEGELSGWIQTNCNYNFIELNKDNLVSMEKRLIEEHTPPINLKHNPDKLFELEMARHAIRKATRDS